MSGDRAKEIRAAGAGAADVGEVATGFLLYGLLPSRFVPGVADRAMHRHTRIEDTVGPKESPYATKGS